MTKIMMSRVNVGAYRRGWGRRCYIISIAHILTEVGGAPLGVQTLYQCNLAPQ